jgi:prepilin-type N-terminal cleavage/methylation domain-containing protein
MKIDLNEPDEREDRGASAFTLPEVLVSIVLVSIVTVSLFAGITQGFVVVDVGRDNMRATQLMVNTMEIVRLYNWDQINSNGFIPTNYTTFLYPTNTSRANALNTVTLANRRAQVQIGITTPNLGTTYQTNMRQVQITVTWTNQNVTRLRTMTSFVAEEGIQKYVY